MKTILLNDTSYYHNGCKEVMNNLIKYYKPTLLVHTNHKIDVAIIEDFDNIVLNGEGTMHHNNINAQKFLKYLQIAQRMNKRTHLVNSVWQNMSEDWNDVLKKCDTVEVREVLSKNEMTQKNKRLSEIVLDVSIHSTPEYINHPSNDVCLGGSFYGKIKIEWDKYHNIDIFKDTWTSLVNTLRNSKLLITGRHHEMYAALKARTPVMIVSGNTWKNQGFFYTANQPDLCMAPTYENILDTLRGKYKNNWNKIWDFLDNQTYKYYL